MDAQQVGTVAECWRYPVKSMQGLCVESVELDDGGVVRDRTHALIDVATGHLLSAKRVAALLGAAATDDEVTLPDGTVMAVDDPGVDLALSSWLGREVQLRSADGTASLSYEMTFDPPDDDAEYYEIPVPAGTFVDLSPLHLLTTATLDGCRRLRPDLDWNVRRFRPSLVIDLDGDPFVEDAWVGRRLRIGDTAEVEVVQPTVRCAMPLRAQPAAGPDGVALDRQVELHHAMNDLHPEYPNHLGAYADVAARGPVSVGDPVLLL